MANKPIEYVAKLSPTQQGMLFHTLFDPQSGAYVVQMSYELEGSLDTAVFRRAWERVVERHSALRTAFYWEESDKPLQVIYRQVDLPWDEQDWRGLVASEQALRAEQLLAEDRARGFDLDAAPLMRLTLIRLAEQRFLFLWTHHHLILDGWCLPLLLRELLACYEAFAQGREPQLPRSRPYRDYIAWLQQQDMQAAEAFWREMLGDVTAPTALLSAPPAASAAPGYQRSDRRLSTEATAALQTLARQHQLTLNTLMQGAWALLLSRYSGENDVVFGIAVSGRPPSLAGVEQMVGLFINTLPLRVPVPAGRPALDWLRDIQNRQAALRQFEHSPLVQVQGWSGVPRGTPLFESILVFENFPAEKPGPRRDGGLILHRHRFVQQTNYPLSLFVIPDAELELQLIYDQQRFDPRAVELLLDHFQMLLESLAQGLAQPLEALPALSRSEQAALAAWNATATDYPLNRSVHELIAEQAARSPDAVAAVFLDQSISYGELDARANRLALHLRDLGVGSEHLVGICMDRSLEMLVALLGVLKAGGAYLPLDPSFPPERVRLMLEDAAPAVVITAGTAIRAEQPAIGEGSWTLVDLTDSWPVIAQLPPEPPGVLVLPEQLAYVIYTSGSTGRPKGVQIPHRALTNFLLAMRDLLPLSARDTLLAVTTLSFDIAGLELFLPLLLGGRVALVEREVVADGERLAAQLVAVGATAMQATPAGWSMLLAAGWTGDPNLTALCGGEPLPPDLAEQLRPRCGALWNLYGPTETTIWSTAWQLGDGPVTIGRPIANTTIELLDQALRPVPLGAAGELYIGGAGVARGYLGRPDLTAERFILVSLEAGDLRLGKGDPAQASSLKPQASVLYKTGDLARWRPDGTLEHLGRIDHQVKLRGFRIELGEIETLLRRHPAVSAAAVIAREDRPGDKRLVAYIVPSKTQEPRTKNQEPNGETGGLSPEARDLKTQHAKLRMFLAEHLPDYMLPAVFVELERLPQTPNGKIDRKALPAPSGAMVAQRFVPPRTEDEAALAEIWAAALQVAQVGAEDNFFDLGGHSLTAVQILARLREHFGVKLPLRVLFEAPTLAGLAARIELARQQGPEAALVAHEALDLPSETRLDPAIVPAVPVQTPAGPPQAVLLTGATGFLGAFLLDELLRSTPARIHCLVRAGDTEQARRRIQASLEHYQLWDARLAERIIPLPGNLARPLLGLDQDTFDHLAGTLDQIYHNGALVNAVYPYSVMRGPNVLGTQEALRLAAQGRPKPLHFVSTTTVFYADGVAPGQLMHEDDPLERWQGLINGYGESKWVAEGLVRAAGARGLPVVIYRPGRIAWDSRSGVWNSSDLLYQMIHGCLQLGSAPLQERTVEITPVDLVSRAIVSLSQRPDVFGRAFHLVNPAPVAWNELIGRLVALGAPLRQIPHAEWLAELRGVLAGEAPNALRALLAIEGADGGLPGASGPLRFDISNTLAGLAGSPIAIPPVDDALLRPLLAALTEEPVGLAQPGTH